MYACIQADINWKVGKEISTKVCMGWYAGICVYCWNKKKKLVNFSFPFFFLLFVCLFVTLLISTRTIDIRIQSTLFIPINILVSVPRMKISTETNPKVTVFLFVPK